jgi:hypothetical protein
MAIKTINNKKTFDRNYNQMEFGDIVYVMERVLGLFYIRVNLPTIMKYYEGNNQKIIADINELMTNGQQSEAWKYWESTQTIADNIATGRV